MIKKCQADMESFALATNSETGKQMYVKNAQLLQKLITTLQPYLK